MLNKLTVSAPGRICLFGEHQDYWGLPVIAAAINLRIFISGTRRNDKIFRLHLPDINEFEKIDFDSPITYIKERDYFRSSVNILLHKKINISYVQILKTEK